ncbi:MAG TPA: hypothetical protein PLM91_06180, partial [Bacillota bacterium]|nr:hypothetical protein [Bacillota bacterium]
ITQKPPLYRDGSSVRGPTLLTDGRYPTMRARPTAAQAPHFGRQSLARNGEHAITGAPVATYSHPLPADSFSARLKGALKKRLPGNACTR